MAKKYLSNVRDQYESYSFPKRDPEAERQRLISCEMDMLGKVNHYGFKGRQSFQDGFRALVAGGGTGDSAVYLAQQLNERGGRVTYLDISQHSMAVAQKRAEIRGLANIDWVHGSILDLPEMDLGRFDYINCAGVLHHMADPDEGLRCLAGVVKDDGCLGLMVYGRCGRMDIYATQELMRLVVGTEPQLSKRVDACKEVLQGLPPNNVLLRGRDREATLKLMLDDEPNLFDALLHEQDRGYSVAELYDWVAQAGLKLIQFTNYQSNGGVCRLEYDPGLYLEGQPVLERIRKRPLAVQQTVAEYMNGAMGLHSFYAAKRMDTVASPEDGEMVPYYLTSHAREMARSLAASGDEGIAVTLRFGVKARVRLQPATKALLPLIDDQTDIDGLAAKLAGLPALGPQRVGAKTIKSAFAKDFDLLNALDILVLRHKKTPPIGTIAKTYS